MPILSHTEYKARFPFTSGHFNSVYAHFARRQVSATYTRKRVTTADGDFLDIDLINTDSKKLIILCHGLEGSSDSSYIKKFANTFTELGYDIAAVNYRGCSGEMNLLPRVYHSGSSDDIHIVVQQIGKNYKTVDLIGFSLGGNMCLKYLGEQVFVLPENVRACVSVSPPTALEACCYQIMKKQNWFYERRFIISLVDKLKQKAIQFPDLINVNELSKAKNLFLFDDLFTAPIHGFKGAVDYYTQCSSKQFIPAITHPSLIITSVDDPFLSIEAIPYKEAEQSQHVYLYPCKYGGHLGFHQKGNKPSWMLEKSVEFISGLDGFII
jgi:predicted alpha/beta-fold hydrolase